MSLREKHNITRDQAAELRIFQLKVYDDMLKKMGGDKAAVFDKLRWNAAMILVCYMEGDEPENVWAQLGN